MSTRNNIFLFGAGASYGAGGIIPETPPLGPQLYSALQNVCPGSWGKLPTDMAQEFSSAGFEAGMKLLYERHATAVPALMRDMAIYFIQFRPHQGNTLYCRLIDDLKRAEMLSHTAFSTLNYECVLEFSLISASTSISYFDSAGTVDSSGCPVWKLHGSCNFFSAQLQASPGIFYSSGVSFEGGIRASLDVGEVIDHYLTKTALAPAMCLYMEGKPVSISPSVIKQIQLHWKQAISEANNVFTVGVNPHPADNHIWEPLASTEAKLYFVGDGAAFDV